MVKIIGALGRHTILVKPAPDIQPGGQMIMIAPADQDGLYLLHALTGAAQGHIALTYCAQGRAWQVEHDWQADQHLMDIVDLGFGLRAASPTVIQLPIFAEEWDGQA